MREFGKKYKENKKNSGTLEQPGRWLMRLGMWGLVVEMAALSAEYKMAWAESWQEHLDDPAWLKRAMVNTFVQLRGADKDQIRARYEDWQWYEKNFDMQYMANPEHWAHCYILDGKKQRAATCNRILKGQTPDEALETLDRDSYEFIRWLF
jgi:hypothetical protein